MGDISTSDQAVPNAATIAAMQEARAGIGLAFLIFGMLVELYEAIH